MPWERSLTTADGTRTLRLSNLRCECLTPGPCARRGPPPPRYWQQGDLALSLWPFASSQAVVSLPSWRGAALLGVVLGAGLASFALCFALCFLALLAATRAGTRGDRY